MCGRFALTMDLPELEEAFPWVEFGSGHKARYNIAPSQNVLTIPNQPGDRSAFFRWGLIPHWSKDAQIGNKMINARSETVMEKPSFKQPFKKRRCLIPASGFYEWKKEPSGKVPYYITREDARPFAFAGLWELWSPEGIDPVYSCAIITTDANETLKPIHHRMPVILDPSEYRGWLGLETASEDDLKEMMRSRPTDNITVFPVSKTVNSPKNDRPDCVQPAAG